MSKRAKRLLSLLLTLVMVMSLGTPAFALGGGSEIGIGGGFGRDIGDDEVRDFDPSNLIEDAEEPVDLFQGLDTERGIQVTVESRNNALPTMAEVRVTPVEAESVREAVEAAVEGQPNILVAMDISFWLDGIEIEPEEPVNVKISAPELTGRTDLQVVHIPDAEDAQAETVELVDESELSFALGTNEVAFKADSFSTYVIVSGEISATVHWGYMDGDDFVEFDESKVIALDTSAGTISLNVDFEGYAYSNALYQAKDSTEQIPVSSTLKKVEGKWQAEQHIHDIEADTTTLTWADLNNGDDIYVSYVELTPSTTPGTPEDPSKVPTPDTDKDVIVNDDGTRTIVLDVTGTKVTEDNSYGANVLIVLDNTSSMNWGMAGQYDYSDPNRWEAAKEAINTLVTTLTPGNADDPDVQYALLDFHCESNGYYRYNVNTLHRWNATSGQHVNSGGTYWNSNGARFNAYIQQDSYSWSSATNGTNWESPLNDAMTILNTRDTDTTYVIFITDGEANCRGTNTVYTNGDKVTPATDKAKLITGLLPAGSVKFYGVFCGGDAGYQNLVNVVTNANGVKTINGTDSATLKSEFSGIAQNILNDLYANDVSVDDGIPSLASVSAQTSGAAGGFEYFRLYPLTAATGGSYTYKVGNDTFTVTAAEFSAKKDSNGNAIEQIDGTWYIEIPWTEGQPGASYNQANGVTWDLSTVNVQPGVTYRLKFKVWPSQEAYDYIADLNNGLVKPMPSDDELKAMGIDKNQQTGLYYLLTNTHLKTNYSFNGEDYSDSPSVLPKDEMILPTSTIKVEKYWHNEMDAREASDVTLTITKDDADYTTVAMGTPTQINEHEWKQTPDVDIFISCGIMTCDSDGKLSVLSDGHDYTVVEPLNFSYRWDLTADVYHPMIINDDTTPTMLTLVQGEDLTDALKALTDNTKNTVDGKTYYKFGKKVYLAEEGSTVLTAENDRRSNLIINKVVDGNGAPATDEFAIKVTLENPNAPHRGDQGYTEWYHGMWFYVSTEANNRNTIVMEGVTVDGAEREVDEQTGDYTGFWWFDNGGTVTVYLKAGQYLNFNNVAKDTEYTIEELEGDKMPAGYTFVKVETDADNKEANETSTPGTVSGNKVTGTIDKPNTDYTATYTNKFDGFFYVYHSSDNTVQRFPMAENGVPVKDFNLAGLTKLDTSLYGGYYLDYAGKSKGFDASTLDYSGETDPQDEGGTPYTADKVAHTDASTNTAETILWSNPETANGLVMQPTANTVYYLKEVPAATFMQPYFHYTYQKACTDEESKRPDNITAGWLISDVDDLNYQETGFAVVDEHGNASIVSSLTVQTTKGGNSIKLTADRVFRAKGVASGTGKLTYAEVMMNSEITAPAFFGNNFSIVQYWLTPDNVFVTSQAMRTYSGLVKDADGYFVKQNVKAVDVNQTIQLLENIADYAVPAGSGD